MKYDVGNLEISLMKINLYVVYILVDKNTLIASRIFNSKKSYFLPSKLCGFAVFFIDISKDAEG